MLAIDANHRDGVGLLMAIAGIIAMTVGAVVEVHVMHTRFVGLPVDGRHDVPQC